MIVTYSNMLPIYIKLPSNEVWQNFQMKEKTMILILNSFK